MQCKHSSTCMNLKCEKHVINVPVNSWPANYKDVPGVCPGYQEIPMFLKEQVL